MVKQFNVRNLDESVSESYAKKLGKDGLYAAILGYVLIPKMFTPTDLSDVRDYANSVFGSGCELHPLPMASILPKHMQRHVNNFKENNPNFACLIYKN